MTTQLQQLQAKLLEQQNKNSGTKFTGDNASYPFWNAPEGSTATVRFLPDHSDSNNIFFWQERQVLKLPFQGVEGSDKDTSNQVIVQVPCVEMWGETCPVIAHTRPWWKDPEKEALARTYWKKKSYLFQGFVVNSPFEEEEVPENPIRRFVVSSSIYEIIKNSLMNPEMEDMPTDYVGGRDFKITKTKKGDWANYGTSQWSFKTRSLSENELIAIEQHGLFNLKEFLGRKPDADELAAITAMFHDSVAGHPYDFASYGKYFKPMGSYGNSDTSTVPVTSAHPINPANPNGRNISMGDLYNEINEIKQSSASTVSKPNAQDILERIKNRTANKA